MTRLRLESYVEITWWSTYKFVYFVKKIYFSIKVLLIAYISRANIKRDITSAYEIIKFQLISKQFKEFCISDFEIWFYVNYIYTKIKKYDKIKKILKVKLEIKN